VQIAQQLGLSMSMIEKHAAKAILAMTNWLEEH
jgi:DNA-directed RNA polymerase specialized sigma24 family protein